MQRDYRTNFNYDDAKENRSNDCNLRYQSELQACEKPRKHGANRNFKDAQSRKKQKHLSKNQKNVQKESTRSKEPTNLDKISQSPCQTVDFSTLKTAAAHISPVQWENTQDKIADKSSLEYQKIAWEELKKSIWTLINKIETTNIQAIAEKLMRENIIRGQGPLVKSLIQAQASAPTLTPLYVALIAIINSKFPDIGELLVNRLVIKFKRAFKHNNKTLCISSGTFIAHLVNQHVVDELLVFDILLLLVTNTTDDSIEIAIAILKECGMKLSEREISRKSMESILEVLRNILHDCKFEERLQYMIEVLFQVCEDGFKEYQAILGKLDRVEEEEECITHIIELTDPTDSQRHLNGFTYDLEFVENEEKYENMIKEILGSENNGRNTLTEESSAVIEKVDDIVDNTETNFKALRQSIYSAVISSSNFDECAHKLMQMGLKPSEQAELCRMFVNYCGDLQYYEKYYGLIAGRLCLLDKTYARLFQDIFKQTYNTIDKVELNKSQNVSKFFAHLLYSNAISWSVFRHIKLCEDETTSNGLVFVKNLFHEIEKHMGLSKLRARINEPKVAQAFKGLLPRDDPRKTRFAINFFAALGFGRLVGDLREHLKAQSNPAPLKVVQDS